MLSFSNHSLGCSSMTFFTIHLCFHVLVLAEFPILSSVDHHMYTRILCVSFTSHSAFSHFCCLLLHIRDSYLHLYLNQVMIGLDVHLCLIQISKISPRWHESVKTCFVWLTLFLSEEIRFIYKCLKKYWLSPYFAMKQNELILWSIVIRDFIKVMFCIVGSTFPAQF